ncbi:MAG: DUF3267 domain-containing protein [Clostridiales bacterium]|nr:DUF3267 domain-containing protein [Clostridiales bacterium]
MRIEVENDQIRARKKQEYEELVAEMDQKGMEARLEKISIVTANVFGVLVFFIVGAISFALFYLIHGREALGNYMGVEGSAKLLLFVVVYAVTIFVHEFIHGFFWHFPCEGKWKSIDFGFNPKCITPYCHCREALNLKQYLWGALAPTVFLGIVPIIVGLVIADAFVLLIGVVGVVGGCGDLMVIWTLRKHKDCMLFDHPYEVGYAYFVKKNAD